MNNLNIGASSTDAIREFQGEFRFLSNFWLARVRLSAKLLPGLKEDLQFEHVEGAYQAAKCANPGDALRFVGLKAFEAKRLGKEIMVHADWNSVKEAIMLDLVRQKFSIPSLGRLLQNTGELHIAEGNAWGDRFWGVDLKTGIGQNRLGKMLMNIREEGKG